jgi:hypothetical protein
MTMPNPTIDPQAQAIERERQNGVVLDLVVELGRTFPVTDAYRYTDASTLLELADRGVITLEFEQVLVICEPLIGCAQPFGNRTRSVDEAYKVAAMARMEGVRFLSSFRPDPDLPLPFKHRKVTATEGTSIRPGLKYHRAHSAKEVVDLDQLYRSNGPTRFINLEAVLEGIENMTPKGFADLVEHRRNRATYRLEVGRVDGKLYAWGDYDKWEQVLAYGIQSLEVTVIDYDKAYEALNK